MIRARRSLVVVSLGILAIPFVLLFPPPSRAQHRLLDGLAAIPLDAGARAIAVGDVDSDGRLDLVTASDTGVFVVLLRSDDWTAWETIRVAEGRFDSVAAADLDGDGDADLVASSSKVWIYWNVGGGAFAGFYLTRGSGETFEDLALADMNGDGRADIVAPSSRRGLHVILREESAESGFGSPLIYPHIPTTESTRLAVVDLNGDSRLDVATAGPAGIAYGDGAGGFFRVDSPPGMTGHHVAAIDYDSDGLVDLVYGYLKDVYVHRNDGATASFPRARTIYMGAYPNVSSLAVAELDHDGVPDLLVGFGGFYAMYGLRVPGPRTLTPLMPGGGVGIRIVDFDRDGYLDGLAIFAGHVVVARGSSAGLTVPASASAKDATNLAIADFDADGRLDMAIGTHFASIERTLSVIGFDAAGRLTTLSRTPVRGNSFEIATGDFDSDGRPDLVLASRGDDRLALLLGGESGFADAGDILFERDPSRPLVVDCDMNGTADVVVDGRDSLFALLGDGQGLFPTTLAFDVGDAAAPGLSADVDEDGFPDVVMKDPTANVLLALHGDPAGLRGPTEITLSAGARRLGCAADFDEDGHVDLTFSDAADTRSALFFFGDGANGFGRSASVVAPSPVGNQRAGDVDGDGHADWVLHGAFLSVLYGNGRGEFLARSEVYGVAYGDSGESFELADFDGDGRDEVAVPDSGSDLVRVVRPSRFDANAALVGTVNRRFDAPANVLFVNDSSGGVQRRVRLAPTDAIVARMAAPPRSIGSEVPFALYAWEGEPTADTARVMSKGLGTFAMPTPFMGGSPVAVWNSTGRATLGMPTEARSPLAPNVVFRRPAGARRAVTFTLQGIIADPGSRGERPASVTNGIVVEIR